MAQVSGLKRSAASSERMLSVRSTIPVVMLARLLRLIKKVMQRNVYNISKMLLYVNGHINTWNKQCQDVAEVSVPRGAASLICPTEDDKWQKYG